MKYCMSAVLLLFAAACSSNREAIRQEDNELSAHASSALKHSGLSVPLAIRTEHEHLHHELEAAMASGGTTGTRAREVAAILLPHFDEEEAYAMPPLGLLERLARNDFLDETQAQVAIDMADRLRREYCKMLKEHEAMTAALHKLAAAARDEDKPEQAAFAESLILHAKNEEQVLYPATLVIGDYLKLPAGLSPETLSNGGIFMIHLKRAYERSSTEDGERILVERLWPRGLTKARAAVDLWAKDVAPSPELRKWFGHDPVRWKQFRQRYWKELKDKKDDVDVLRHKARKGKVTFIYAAHDEQHNGALALKEFIEQRAK